MRKIVLGVESLPQNTQMLLLFLLLLSGGKILSLFVQGRRIIIACQTTLFAKLVREMKFSFGLIIGLVLVNSLLLTVGSSAYPISKLVPSRIWDIGMVELGFGILLGGVLCAGLRCLNLALWYLN